MDEDKTDITINTYDNIVDEYVDYFKSKDLGNNVQFQSEIDYIVSNINDNASILDVGTAIGDYPKYLTEQCNKNFNVVGIDASNNMLERAIKNAPKSKFELMDIRELKFEPNTFDAIICFATLIHINDTECMKVLDKFNEILKDKGLIAINVMELLDNKKESLEIEPFNPKYKTYFNRYTKQFFIDYFSHKNYEILKFYDNPIFNAEKTGENFSKTNQFSIIVKK